MFLPSTGYITPFAVGFYAWPIKFFETSPVDHSIPGWEDPLALFCRRKGFAFR
jgi:hypothetical protein